MTRFVPHNFSQHLPSKLVFSRSLTESLIDLDDCEAREMINKEDGGGKSDSLNTSFGSDTTHGTPTGASKRSTITTVPANVTARTTLKKEVVFETCHDEIFPISPRTTEGDLTDYAEPLKSNKSSDEPVILQDVVLDDEDFDFSVEEWERDESYTFPNSRVESEFQRAFNKAAKDKRIAFFLLVISFSIIVFSYDLYLEFNIEILMIIIHSLIIVVSGIFAVSFWLGYPRNLSILQENVLLVAYVFFVLIAAASSSFISNIFFVPLYNSLILCINLLGGFSRHISMYLSIAVIATYAAGAIYTELDKELDMVARHLTWSVLWGVCCIVFCYNFEWHTRIAWIMGHRLKLERTRSDFVLSRVLPGDVISQMRQGQRVAKEYDYNAHYKGATVLFVNIVDFEERFEQAFLPAKEMVNFLNRVFFHFDTLTDKHDVFKVETVGQIYMVASGIPELVHDQEGRPDHARRCADLALEIIESSKYVLIHEFGKRSWKFDVKIGINTGTVIAGVIGARLPRYRLIGDTVNVASRMQSTATPNDIQITQQTYDILPQSDYRFQRLAGVKVKGKGLMTTYLIAQGIAPRHHMRARRKTAWKRASLRDSQRVSEQIITSITKSFTQKIKVKRLYARRKLSRVRNNTLRNPSEPVLSTWTVGRNRGSSTDDTSSLTMDMDNIGWESLPTFTGRQVGHTWKAASWSPFDICEVDFTQLNFKHSDSEDERQSDFPKYQPARVYLTGNSLSDIAEDDPAVMGAMIGSSVETATDEKEDCGPTWFSNASFNNSLPESDTRKLGPVASSL